MRTVTEILDKIVEEYKKESPKAERDWRTYEQRLMERMRSAIRNWSLSCGGQRAPSKL